MLYTTQLMTRTEERVAGQVIVYVFTLPPPYGCVGHRHQKSKEGGADDAGFLRRKLPTPPERTFAELIEIGRTAKVEAEVVSSASPTAVSGIAACDGDGVDGAEVVDEDVGVSVEDDV